MGAPANQQLELISSNSISKGISGEGSFYKTLIEFFLRWI